MLYVVTEVIVSFSKIIFVVKQGYVYIYSKVMTGIYK